MRVKTLVPAGAKAKVQSAPAEAPAAPSPPAIQAEIVEEGGLDAARLGLVERIVQGVPIAKIARQLNVHRNTIYNWLGEELVRKEIQRREGERMEQVERRRKLETEILADQVSRLTFKTMDDLTKNPRSSVTLNRFQQYAKEFRAWRQEERLDAGFGQNGPQKHLHLHQHAGDDPSNSKKATANMSFKKFIQDGLQKVELKTLPQASDAGELVKQVLREQLMNGDLIDKLDEEDRQDDDA